MVDPFLTASASGFPFVDVVFEFQVMCSDRVDPLDPEEASEEELAPASTQIPESQVIVPAPVTTAPTDPQTELS
jgi:hypothetical protein